MAQPWGKMSSSPVGKELISFASPCAKDLGESPWLLGRSWFQRQVILAQVAGTQWHLGGELKPSQAWAEGLHDALKTNAMAHGAVRAECSGLGVSGGR